MNQKLLQQLALAKEAGTKAMAKDFFSPVQGQSDPQTEAADQDTAPMDPNKDDAGARDAQGLPGGEGKLGGAPGGDQQNPADLEELLRLLGADGGGAGV